VSDPLLQTRNHHTVTCGDPPTIYDDDPNMYIGYFENAFGEQWVFSFDRATREATTSAGARRMRSVKEWWGL